MNPSDLLPSGAPANDITNAAASKIYGIDADVRYQLTDHLNVFAGANFNHARYTKWLTAPRYIITPANTYPQFPTDVSGGHMIRAPDFTATLQASYTADLAGGKLALSPNLYYTSKYYWDVAQQIPAPSYAVLGLRMAWTDPSDRYTVALVGKNLTDKAYQALVALSARGVQTIWAAPRTVEATVRVRF